MANGFVYTNPDPLIYARKGEQLTCVDGHLIGTFTRDVRRNERMYVDMFTDRARNLDWRPNSMLLGGCPYSGCKAQLNGGTGPMGAHFSQLYINGAWR